jgi:hypothetical protein
MDEMKPKETVTLPRGEYFNAKSSADRLKDAYGDRSYQVSRQGKECHIKRTA